MTFAAAPFYVLVQCQLTRGRLMAWSEDPQANCASTQDPSHTPSQSHHRATLRNQVFPTVLCAAVGSTIDVAGHTDGVGSAQTWGRALGSGGRFLRGCDQDLGIKCSGGAQRIRHETPVFCVLEQLVRLRNIGAFRYRQLYQCREAGEL